MIDEVREKALLVARNVPSNLSDVLIIMESLNALQESIVHLSTMVIEPNNINKDNIDKLVELITKSQDSYSNCVKSVKEQYLNLEFVDEQN